jgi:hypothetical protein
MHIPKNLMLQINLKWKLWSHRNLLQFSKIKQRKIITNSNKRLMLSKIQLIEKLILLMIYSERKWVHLTVFSNLENLLVPNLLQKIISIIMIINHCKVWWMKSNKINKMKNLNLWSALIDLKILENPWKVVWKSMGIV